MNIVLKIAAIKGKINNWLKDNREYRQFKKDYEEILNELSKYFFESALEGYNTSIIDFDLNEAKEKDIIDNWFEISDFSIPIYILKDKYKKYLTKFFKIKVTYVDYAERSVPRIKFIW